MAKITLRQAAQIMNVSVRSVERARRVQQLAPDLNDQIRAGKLSLGEAELSSGAGMVDTIKAEAQNARSAIRRLHKKLAAQGWKTTPVAVLAIRAIQSELDALWEENARHMAGASLAERKRK